MQLLIFGFGYSGAAIARAAGAVGHSVISTRRGLGADAAPAGVTLVPFPAAAEAVQSATHIVSTVPPAADGDAPDPVIAAYGPAMRRAPELRWAGYLSTTGVYGDRGGGWVDETTPPAPGQDRSRRRLAAEEAWAAALGGRVPVDLFRTAGIYGPGRSAFDELRRGTARRVIKPGHAFGHIHVDDIARAVVVAAGQARDPGVRVLHLCDDAPATSAEITEEAARLLGVPPPPAFPYEEIAPRLSDMARSFWAENRRICSRLTQTWLGATWLYPTYREGLRAILAAERPAAEQRA